MLCYSHGDLQAQASDCVRVQATFNDKQILVKFSHSSIFKYSAHVVYDEEMAQHSS